MIDILFGNFCQTQNVCQKETGFRVSIAGIDYVLRYHIDGLGPTAA